MIAGDESTSGNRVEQADVTYFDGLRIHPLAHRREDHTLLSRYLIDAGVPENLHSDNAWGMTKRSKWNKVMDEKGAIKVSQTEPQSPLQNNAKREIQ